MQFDQAFDQSETNPEATALPLLHVDLREQIKDVAKPFVRYSRSIIPHFQHGIATGPFNDHLDATTERSELGSVVQQICDHLRHAHRVNVDLQPRWLDGDCQMVSSGLNRGTTRLCSISDKLCDISPFLLKLDLSSSDPTDFQKIIDHASHVLDVSRDHLQYLRLLLPRFIRPA